MPIISIALLWNITPYLIFEKFKSISNLFSLKKEDSISKDSEDLKDIHETVEKDYTIKQDFEEELKSEDVKDDISIEVEEISFEEIGTKNIEFVKSDSTKYDPTLELRNFKNPNLDLLKDYGDGSIKIDKDELESNKEKIVETLKNYNIGIKQIKATIGPTVTLYEIIPDAGVRISKIKNLEDDIALSLSALGIRIIAPIPGKGTIGIEVPNKKKINSLNEITSILKKIY